uniref:Odorant-binding protein 1 n=1 Tax=Heortia vitessoides TaxID=1557813 RepID=A0A978W795_9NEOP|nr:odorant-binding protein 1 [Heortia vitessoides]
MTFHSLYYIFTFYFIASECYVQALNCRSEGGPKEDELKTIYATCLKKQDGRNSSEREDQEDSDWKESRGRFNQRTKWNRDMRDKNDRIGGRDDRLSETGDRMNDRYDRTDEREDRFRSRDDRMSNRDERMNGREDRMRDRDDRMDGRDYSGGNMMSKDNGYGREQLNSRYFPHEDFSQTDGHDSDMSKYNGYSSTTQASRRFKRGKRTEINSGQRSQYNPNTKKPTEQSTYGDDNRNSSNSSGDMNNKACALHCFLEQLEMTDDNGMPDRYLVTHSITKDVKNEDLKDFLQESIEECFQILDNENTEDKCEFSKNLMMCLSEKGRANCDDWKDDLQF